MNAFLEWLLACIWLAWFAYWVISARGGKPVQRYESAGSRAAHSAPLVVAVCLLASPRIPPGWLSGRFIGRTLSGFVAGAVITVLGLALTVWARRLLGANWSATVTVKQEHELVLAGPYRQVRHPIYSGLLLAFAGSALARGEWRGILALPIALFAFWLKWRTEERMMNETFGAAYRDYAARTPAVFPRIF